MLEEQATGIIECGKLVPHCNISGKIFRPSWRKASAMIWNGHEIEVPGSGAGSYIKVARKLGIEISGVFDNSSSAGDFAFLVEGADDKLFIQRNRYPYFGFGYSLVDKL